MTDDMFGEPTVNDVSLSRMILCVERELRFRERVYGRRVQVGKMTQEQADEETLVMSAVLENLLAQGREAP